MFSWQLDEIRKALSLSKSKKSPHNLALDLHFHVEINKEDLLMPQEFLNELNEKIYKELTRAKQIVAAVLESPTKAVWLEKRKLFFKE